MAAEFTRPVTSGFKLGTKRGDSSIERILDFVGLNRT
jgi:hypothetical protein